MAGKDDLTEQLNIRVSANDLDALDELRGTVKRANAARTAFRLGVLQLRRKKGLLTEEITIQPRKPKKPPSG